MCLTIKRNNLTPKGLCFYSIYNVPLDENMVTEFYMEVEEKIIQKLKNHFIIYTWKITV